VLSAKEKKSENIKNRGPKKHHSFLSFFYFARKEERGVTVEKKGYQCQFRNRARGTVFDETKTKKSRRGGWEKKRKTNNTFSLSRGGKNEQVF
jgi:hypothetical protein